MGLRRIALTAVAVVASTGAVTVVPFAPASAEPGSAAAGRSWLPQTPAQWPLVVDAQTTRPQQITRGVERTDVTVDTVGGRQHGQVLNVDLSDSNVRLGVVESHDRLTDPSNEVISSMAHRTHAVAGINADFFNIYGSGSPLGMVTIDGRLVKSPNPGWTASLGVRRDGSITIGTETYTGSVTDGGATHALASVNTPGDVSGGLVRFTSDVGATGLPSASVVAYATADPAHPEQLRVQRIDTGVTALAQLPADTQAVAGAGAAGTWLTGNVHVGDTLQISEKISPDSDLRQAVSGGAILVKDGVMAVPLHGDGENNVNYPVTGVGVTRDGKHAVFAVFDGHAPESVATGLTRPQMAGWMLAHGAYNAILFDSGGSTEMVGRLPGQTEATVLNVPSDGHERPVANGLFIYSTAAAAGPAKTASVNDGKPLVTLAGGAITVPAWATDAAGNPATDPVRLTVQPPSLARVDGTRLTGLRAGRGRLTVTAGSARSSVPLTVTDRLQSLTITPDAPNLDNGAHQPFTVAGTARDGTAVELPTTAVSWSIDKPALGSVDAAGTLTTAATGSGMLTVTATAGGASAHASVAIGQTPVVLDSMADVSRWSTSLWSAQGSISASSDVPPGSSSRGSMDMHYTFTHTGGVQKVMISPTVPIAIGPDAHGQNPAAIGVWVKGNADLATVSGGTPGAIVPGVPTLGEIYTQASTQPITFWPQPVTHDGWRLITAALPAGLSYPLTVNQLKLVIINSPRDFAGDVKFGDLEALYSPRLPAPDTYQAVPANPRWLQYATDPAQFRADGKTLAVLDDAHLVASDPKSTGSVVMHAIGDQLRALPAQAKPDQIQAMGDMSDDGKLADLTYVKSMLDGYGVPYRNAVGNHEITQGADPETGNFQQVFGDTRYTYRLGTAEVVTTDSAHTGILASDPYQNPAGDQYPWLVDKLTASTAKTVIIATHMPAYDPHPVANSQFADRWEARMYERLAAKYQASHPQTHVLLLFGHARGYAETLLAPDGTTDAHGLPNFVVADAGAPPYADPQHGGFYNYALFHLGADGTVQYSVQPVFAHIDIQSPAGTLTRGQTVRLTAAALTPAGDDTTPIRVPVGDPAARTWTSSDHHVATVDPATGAITAHHAGQVTITCTSGGASGSTNLTVNS